MIYHRKVNSIIIGNYLIKLDLPSNSNIINLLKYANETFAFNQSKNFSQTNLYKNVSYNKNESASKNSISKIINIQSPLHYDLSSARNFKISNSYKTQIIKGPKFKGEYSM